MDQYIKRQVAVLGSDGLPTGETIEVLEAQYNVRWDGPVGTKWGICAGCGIEFPLSQMSTNNGKNYCRTYGCDKDFRPKRPEKS